MDEVPMVEIFKSVLVRVMSVGATIEVHRQRIHYTILITRVLRNIQYMCNDELGKTHSIFLFIKHEGSNGSTHVSMSTGLASDVDSGMAPAVLILGVGNRAGRHRHDEVGDGSNQSG